MRQYSVADIFSAARRSFVMSKILGRGNQATEMKLVIFMRRHRVGGWRRKQRLFGAPDFVFSDAKLIVFVDGCFWHHCPKHGRVPDGNRQYWISKLARNKARDRLVNCQLRSRGWRVLRIWQHELKNETRVIGRLRRALHKAAACSNGVGKR